MKILLPIDLVDPHKEANATNEAIKQAKAFDAEIHLLTVLPDFNNPLLKSLYDDNVGDKAKDKTIEKLKEYSQQYLSGIETKAHFAMGTVYKKILNKAEILGINLIVISASRPELADYLLGPNTAKVVRHANCSVLVVRDDI